MYCPKKETKVIKLDQNAAEGKAQKFVLRICTFLMKCSKTV